MIIWRIIRQLYDPVYKQNTNIRNALSNTSQTYTTSEYLRSIGITLSVIAAKVYHIPLLKKFFGKIWMVFGEIHPQFYFVYSLNSWRSMRKQSWGNFIRCRMYCHRLDSLLFIFGLGLSLSSSLFHDLNWPLYSFHKDE